MCTPNAFRLTRGVGEVLRNGEDNLRIGSASVSGLEGSHNGSEVRQKLIPLICKKRMSILVCASWGEKHWDNRVQPS